MVNLYRPASSNKRPIAGRGNMENPGYSRIESRPALLLAVENKRAARIGGCSVQVITRLRTEKLRQSRCHSTDHLVAVGSPPHQEMALAGKRLRRPHRQRPSTFIPTPMSPAVRPTLTTEHRASPSPHAYTPRKTAAVVSCPPSWPIIAFAQASIKSVAEPHELVNRYLGDL